MLEIEKLEKIFKYLLINNKSKNLQKYFSFYNDLSLLLNIKNSQKKYKNNMATFFYALAYIKSFSNKITKEEEKKVFENILGIYYDKYLLKKEESGIFFEKYYLKSKNIMEIKDKKEIYFSMKEQDIFYWKFWNELTPNFPQYFENVIDFPKSYKIESIAKKILIKNEYNLLNIQLFEKDQKIKENNIKI